MVNPKHFDFGFQVIKLVSKAVTQTKLEGALGITESEKEKLLEDEKLKEDFLKVTESHEALDDEQKLKVLRQLLEKVVDVKFNDVVTLIGRRKTGRGTKQATRIEETTRGTVDLLAAMKKNRKG